MRPSGILSVNLMKRSPSELGTSSSDVLVPIRKQRQPAPAKPKPVDFLARAKGAFKEKLPFTFAELLKEGKKRANSAQEHIAILYTSSH